MRVNNELIRFAPNLVLLTVAAGCILAGAVLAHPVGSGEADSATLPVEHATTTDCGATEKGFMQRLGEFADARADHVRETDPKDIPVKVVGLPCPCGETAPGVPVRLDGDGALLGEPEAEGGFFDWPSGPEEPRDGDRPGPDP